jgi:DNA (cytosine-5)-methyltransferase 1
MHKGPRGTEAVESGHVVTVGTLRAHHPGTAGTQSDTDHIVATYPINTQLGLRGPDTSNTVREGLGLGNEGDPAYTLQAGHGHAVAIDNAHAFKVRGGCEGGGKGYLGSDEVAFTISTNQDQHIFSEPAFTDVYNGSITGEVAATMGTSGSPLNSAGPQVLQQSTVRRLTPVECERLQGFPDNFTAIPWGKKEAADCPDGPRYKALGNSMAVPVMRWIGERIRLIDDYISII